MNLRETLDSLKQTLNNELSQAVSLEKVEKLRIEFLGRKGSISELMSRLQELPKEERPAFGQAVNAAKEEITSALEAKKNEVLEQQEKDFLESFDCTMQSRLPWQGSVHPINTVMEDICRILNDFGFETVVGPEVETDYYNFETLNFPHDHPARDMQDTLFIADKVLLRTHTSPMQIRAMKERTRSDGSIPHLAIIAPGKVYRRDSDLTHTPMFHQVEALLVGEKIALTHLRGILSALCKSLFGEETKVRFRPSFFPFTEPSLEADVTCMKCGGAGQVEVDGETNSCRICKSTGWLEILGSGMVDPAVFEAVGYDPKKVSGFAFGLGVERIAMLKYGISDLRMNFENDVRFLSQFEMGNSWRRT